MNSYIKSISGDVAAVADKVRAELLDGKRDASVEPGRSITARLQRAEWALERARALLDQAAQLSSEVAP